jgi:hypothetical protein
MSERNEQSIKELRIESGLGKMWQRRKEDHWRKLKKMWSFRMAEAVI